MIFYHITLNLMEVTRFYPRVPENAEDWDEECETPRICVAPTIEGCLTAMPVGVLNLPEWLEENDNLVKIYKLDTDKYGIKRSDIVTPQELDENEYVTDAIITGEHWVTKPVHFKDEDVSIVRIDSYKTVLVNSHGVPKLTKEYESGDSDVVKEVKYTEIKDYWG